ncbi:Type II secretory pathway component [Stutzerimonas kirkiae]|uniref:Type II secretory pathway component n=1 Tax=Stutzerimonas kirkiae TaxID=2211392 RepID=A0A4Q9RGT5_9GAMM|nr:Type II secretory pathway component [Stutzerimonas kirkiae]TBV05821.1 Type II secretory pathway component [Stutzerimonas kirkiae]TBV10662.1 Type II secretory pathway component [Stutzerimonas kirkiae]TBV17619.1 Type II secretory pathway component [Stutzerimonas kirkiae]
MLAVLASTLALARDPTQPPVELTPKGAQAPPASLQLQAILRSPQVSRAVINGQPLKVGERLGDARVLAIHSHSVLIEREGQRETLRLATPVITPSRAKP